jgi:hypothetical protein
MSRFFKFIGYLHHLPADSTCVPHALHVNTSGKAGTQIPHLRLGDDSSPRGISCSRQKTLYGLHGCVLQVAHSHLSMQNIKMASNKLLVNNN